MILLSNRGFPPDIFSFVFSWSCRLCKLHARIETDPSYDTRALTYRKRESLIALITLWHLFVIYFCSFQIWEFHLIFSKSGRTDFHAMNPWEAMIINRLRQFPEQISLINLATDAFTCLHNIFSPIIHMKSHMQCMQWVDGPSSTFMDYYFIWSERLGMLVFGLSNCRFSAGESVYIRLKR